MTGTLFDDWTHIYEAMIDWPKRLAHEEPFYRRLFEDCHAQSVIDMACGTGRHAAMFHSWGLQVEGADISPEMIRRAAASFGAPPGLRWVVRGFDESLVSSEPYDAAICVGNSLALAPDGETVGRVIERLVQAVREGGIIVVHVLNLWRLPDGPCVWQKCRRAALPQGEVLIVKGVHRCGRQGFVDLVVASLEGDPVLLSESIRFWGLEAEELERMTRGVGVKEVRFFGGYQDQAYDPQASTDLVMVAER